MTNENTAEVVDAEVVEEFTAESLADLPEEERHAKFVAAATEGGATVEDAEAVYKIITEISPPRTAEHVIALGLPMGQAQYRVEREYDTTLAEHDLPGWVSISLNTMLGPVLFAVNRDELIAALTVEVPYVSPQKAPQES